MILDKLLDILNKAENEEKLAHLTSPYILLYMNYVSTMELAM